MYRIGLTGGIASGKSTVVKVLLDMGAAVIDADRIARQVVEPGEAAYEAIVAHFGARIVRSDGQIDRQQLGQIIFSDRQAREKLNSIVHPHVIDRMEQMIDDLHQQGYQQPVILDIPLLIETSLQAMMDEIWVVMVDQETQLRRLMQRNQLTRDQALQRIRAQLPLNEKAAFADQIIDNNGSLDATRQQVELAYQQAIARAKVRRQPFKGADR
ncbi:MAG: dephospho-CoA kinase [Bacillota bacterium]